MIKISVLPNADTGNKSRLEPEGYKSTDYLTRTDWISLFDEIFREPGTFISGGAPTGMLKNHAAPYFY